MLFSSGISEQSGVLQIVKNRLEECGYICSYWRELFSNAKDADNIALLPMLIKKIPTFDFAVLICEGHDKTIMYRDGQKIEVATMRDNVLFEIGLCSMALGLNRTILLTDGQVRLPDDLTGINQSLALKHISYHRQKKENFRAAAQEAVDYIYNVELAVQEVDTYIHANYSVLSPVVIGAATTTACGYVGNFVLRTLEHIQDGVILEDGQESVRIPLNQIFFHIILPVVYLPETFQHAHNALASLKKGWVPTARFRKAEFSYELRNNELHIYDYPTTLVTSYNTAKMILKIDADDSIDLQAAKRFTAKELDLFEASLHILLAPDFIRQTVEHYYKELPLAEREALICQLIYMVKKQVFVERIDY